MESSDHHPIAASLALRAGRGVNAAQIADVVVTACQDIDTALAPIVGQRGVAALCKRSIHLAGAAYPWLAGLPDGVDTGFDLAALNALLSKQNPAAAAGGGGALLQAFDELLHSLVGASLTERLLRSAWAKLLNGSPAQDTSA